MIPCMYTYRAAAFWIVGGYQEGKLKHGPSVDPTTHTQQSIPYFGREEREITFSTNTAVIKKTHLMQRYRKATHTLQALDVAVTEH